MRSLLLVAFSFLVAFSVHATSLEPVSMVPLDHCSGCTSKTSTVESAQATLQLTNPSTGGTVAANVQLNINVGPYSQECTPGQVSVCAGARCFRELSITRSVTDPAGGTLDSAFNQVNVQLCKNGVDVGSPTSLTSDQAQVNTVRSSCNAGSVRYTYTLVVTSTPPGLVASWSADAATATYVFDCNSCLDD